MKLKYHLKKFCRYAEIYGFSRALNKVLGRTRNVLFKKIYFSFPKKEVSIIGCGQFAFSSISYFISKKFGNVFLDCYDINLEQAKSLSSYYRYERVSDNYTSVLTNPKLNILYIASNHASHSSYALEAIKHGVRNIYIEKPISTSLSQFVELVAYKRKNNAFLYAGYNRPFSNPVSLLKNNIIPGLLPITLNCFITGHFLEKDHWYRNPEEGTRICGNMGHWIDLCIHLLCQRGLPKKLDISILYANLDEPDDNLSVGFTSDFGDLITIILSSRSEPFEGINESIHFQQGTVISKIDDFRNITIWKDDLLIKKNFFVKDLGHKQAILQPFSNKLREWREIEYSTLLMLFITDMVKNRQTQQMFVLENEIKSFDDSVQKIVASLSH